MSLRPPSVELLPLLESSRELLARFIANEALPEGLDPRGARDELWLAMTDFVVQAAGRSPTVLVLEDMQWADPDSIEWVDHVLGRAQGLPLYVLVLVRPEFFRTQDKTPRFSGRDHLKLDLRPISRRSVRGIAKAILGEDVAEEVLERIAAQAAGSPLFAEELARLTALGRDTHAAPTIEAAIQVSLDALEESSSSAVARLSVFGLAGWDKGLEALGVASPDGPLHQLSAVDLLIEQAESRLAGSREWAFKHALVRDVAYASLDDAAKTELHALAGFWLAKMGEDAAPVAKHFEIGKQEAEAAVHWERAARRALSTNALSEAVQMAEAALMHSADKPTMFARALLLDEAWTRLDPRAADRETALSAMQDATFDEASRVRAEGSRARYDHARGAGTDIVARLVQTRASAKRLLLVDEEARCTATLATRYAFEGRLEDAASESDNLLEIAETRGMPAAAVDAWQTLAVVYQTKGELVRALDARRNAAKAASRAGLKEREAMLSVNLGFALTTIGARREAKDAIDNGLAIAHAIGSIGAVRHGRMNLLGWTATFGADPSADGELAEPRADADAAAACVWTTPDRASLGVLFYRACECLGSLDPSEPTSELRASGEADAAARAEALFKLCTEAYRATGNRDIIPVALGMWALAEAKCQRHEHALALAEEAATLIEQGAPSLLNESPVFLALHDAYLAVGDSSAAVSAIRRGLAPLTRRLQGLRGTSYAPIFLSELPQNKSLLKRAGEYGLTPPEIKALLVPSALK